MTTTELMIGNWVLDTRTNMPLRVNPFMSEKIHFFITFFSKT